MTISVMLYKQDYYLIWCISSFHLALIYLRTSLGDMEIPNFIAKAKWGNQPPPQIPPLPLAFYLCPSPTTSI